MTPIARRSKYPFYHIVDVKAETFQDIKDKLAKIIIPLGGIQKYTVFDEEGRDVLVFGSMGFRSEINESSNSR